MNDNADPTAARSDRTRPRRQRSLRVMAGVSLGGLVALAALGGPALGQAGRAGRAGDAQRYDLRWGRYTSEQSRTEVDVPLALFEVSRSLRQGVDGHLFQSRDGRAELRASGSSAPRVVGSFDAYRKLVAQDEPTMSYRAGGKSWFVLSGRQGGEIRYTKVIERCGAAHSIFLRYPASQKRLYDPIVSRMSSSLSASCSAQ